MQKKPTVAEVARLAGVSVAAASRALNGVGRESEATRERVRVVAAEIGYAPNAAARSLRRSLTGQLLLVVAEIENPVYIELMRSMKKVARRAGYRLLVQSTDGEADEELAVIEGLASGYVDGVVFCPIRMGRTVEARLESQVTPVVVIGRPETDAAIDHVFADGQQAAAQATTRLILQGHTRLGMISGPAGWLPARFREAGYRSVAADHPEVRLAVPINTEFSRRGGYESAAQLSDVDAVLCANDQIALGVLEYCAAHDIQVPEQLAVVGMDNTAEGRNARPPLSSVDLGFVRRGELATQRLLERIASPELESGWHREVATKFLERASSATTLKEDSHE
jgi:LacI family transcriptional regulator